MINLFFYYKSYFPQFSVIEIILVTYVVQLVIFNAAVDISELKASSYILIFFISHYFESLNYLIINLYALIFIM